MVVIEHIGPWLTAHLNIPSVLEAWIFGSSVIPGTRPGDIDVYVRYIAGNAAKMIEIKSGCENPFLREFGIPLHFLFLTEREATENAEFLKIALERGSRIL